MSEASSESTEPESGSSAHIVIAGGSGFIGRRLAAELAGQQLEVIVLSRSPRPAVGPVRFVVWTPEAPGDWCAVLEGAAAVVNLCGESIGGPRWSDERKRAITDSRVVPTTTLVAAVNACRQPPGAFVQISGVGYYGTGSEPVDEEAAAGEDFLARLAMAWEAPLAGLREDVRPVIARLGVVLGKTGGALGQMLMPFKLFVGGPIASGNQWLSWIHLHDATAALGRLAIDPAARGVFNVTSPAPVRNHTFAEAAGKALRRPSFMITPRFMLRALLGEQSTLVCDGQQALPARLDAMSFAFRYPSIQAALADLV